MKDRLLSHSFRSGMLSTLLVVAGMILSLQGCLLPPPPGRIVVQGPEPLLSAPPVLYVIPGTYAYFVADVDADIFFYQGFWYRPHADRWYRASAYNGPWNFIVINQVPPVLQRVPSTYRRVAPGSSRLPYHDVQNNWRTWERERHWDRHDERKRERFEDEDRGRGRDRDNGRDNGRGRGRDEFRDEGKDSRPPQQEDRRGLNRDEDRSGGKGREQNVQRSQESSPAPVRQLTQPRVQQQEKKQTPQEKQQNRKKSKDKGKKKEKSQDSSSSQGGDENGRDEGGQGKGKGR